MPSDSNATCATVMLAADQTSVRTASQSTAVTLTPLSSTSDDLPHDAFSVQLAGNGRAVDLYLGITAGLRQPRANVTPPVQLRVVPALKGASFGQRSPSGTDDEDPDSLDGDGPSSSRPTFHLVHRPWAQVKMPAQLIDRPDARDTGRAATLRRAVVRSALPSAQLCSVHARARYWGPDAEEGSAHDTEPDVIPAVVWRPGRPTPARRSRF
ncbi:hypothetical protein V8E36_002066 [Tilletia maclaganii]